jgi:hypothetical protein
MEQPRLLSGEGTPHMTGDNKGLRITEAVFERGRK